MCTSGMIFKRMDLWWLTSHNFAHQKKKYGIGFFPANLFNIAYCINAHPLHEKITSHTLVSPRTKLWDRIFSWRMYSQHCIIFWPQRYLNCWIGLLAPSHLNMSPSSQSWTHIRARFVQFRGKKKLKTYRFCLLLFLQKNGSLVAPPRKPSSTCTRLIDMRLCLDRARVCHL